jgi:4-amino-4-deoxy-L-arabinose transferase-like glycosyltransferase
LRLPNAVFGALTTVALFLLTESLFGARVAAWAALFWALDVNATSINRIGKEDTLLVFFLLLGCWCFEQAIATYANLASSRTWFARSGAAFGLMLASKYFPQLLGLHTLFAKAAQPRPGTRRATRFWVWMGAAFIVANFALFTPDNLRWVGGYIKSEFHHTPAQTALGLRDNPVEDSEARDLGLWRREHTGYRYLGHVYNNLVQNTPWGLPFSCYFVAIAAKTPLLVLGAFGVGTGLLVRRPRERGFVFARVFLVFTLLGYSLSASKFLRYLLPTIAVVDMVAATGAAFVLDWLASRLSRLAVRRVAVAASVMAIVASLLSAEIGAAPFYGTYQNVFGARVAPPGMLFPNCEFYDAGLREASGFVAGRAAKGAFVVSDAPIVTDEYFSRENRTDIDNWSLSSRGIPSRAAETWVIVQEGRFYLENEMTIDHLRAWYTPVWEYRICNVRVVQVFRLPGVPAGSTAPAGRY